jgi:hypothetical protein
VSDRTRHTLAAAFAAVAAVSMLSPQTRAPSPQPGPTSLVLEGKFFGPTAAEDAANIAAITDELARIIEWDGQATEDHPDAWLKTAVQFDELRIAAREGRMRGQSIGERQPKVRDEIRHYLDEAVGISGGPVSPEQRAKWVDAFLTISGAASRAAGK